MLKFVSTGVSLALAVAIVKGDDANSNGTAITGPALQRIAYAGPDGFSISWSTPSKVDSPVVSYGPSASQLSLSATGVSQTYENSPSWDNHVLLSGLNSNTTYFYKIDGDSTGVRNFTTSLNAGSTDAFVFAMVNDMGTFGNLGLSSVAGKGEGGLLQPGEINTIQSLANFTNDYQFIWHVGDIAYADYWLKEENQHYLPNSTIADGFEVYNSILNAFYDEISVLTSAKPYLVGPGNHDGDCIDGSFDATVWGETFNSSICAPGQKNFTGYSSHWRMPSNESGGVGNMWYSFDYGSVHFVQISTETDFADGIIAPDELGGIQGADSGPFGAKNEQVNWLTNDLQNVDRSKTPWVIVGGHRPWYQPDGDGCWECQASFEKILVDNNVDLIVHGHVHNYQRLDPLAFNETDSNGLDNPSSPWYIINGFGGHYDGTDKLVYPLLNYTAFAQDTAYGWSKFTVHNCTHITHEFISSSNGSVLDTATLFKDRQCTVSQLSNTSTSNTSSSTPSTVPTSTEESIASKHAISSYAMASLAVFVLFWI
ncbi:hypothetical protein AWJ20_5018 [Sugiyamaella lignohabitans]|uniref:Purple acid phosphatase n=1 Tax=Sugiyamaella lignohabitans TaxID=796027 RepID=A0A167EGP9_9ASCO|nr:uncharacterized protein AWJ20_5018 [Sugiyamaella lignohabitans]ANB14062.1 hypothetical protein AWJ20_5018 [Sugiyamaella lignohabitans]